MSVTIYFVIYSAAIVIASLVGGWTPMWVRLTHRRLQIATSLIAGFMLGVALLHLMPHALLMGASITTIAISMLAGLLAMFFLERFFSYHHHTAPGEEGLPPVTADPEPAADCDRAPGEPIDHQHGHQHDPGSHTLSWTGVGVGLVMHSVIAGAALAASMAAEAGHAIALPGFAVFLVIVLHKPFDSMTLLTLMKASGWPSATQHLVNTLFALAVPLGGVLFFLGIQSLDAHDNHFIGAAVAVAAGVFLCVALADLLPEVHFHKHDRGLLSAALLAGLGLAAVIAYFEHSSHAHHDGHGHGTPAHQAPAGHDGHDHGHDGHDHHGHDHHDH